MGVLLLLAVLHLLGVCLMVDIAYGLPDIAMWNWLVARVLRGITLDMWLNVVCFISLHIMENISLYLIFLENTFVPVYMDSLFSLLICSSVIPAYPIEHG